MDILKVIWVSVLRTWDYFTHVFMFPFPSHHSTGVFCFKRCLVREALFYAWHGTRGSFWCNDVRVHLSATKAAALMVTSAAVLGLKDPLCFISPFPLTPFGLWRWEWCGSGGGGGVLFLLSPALPNTSMRGLAGEQRAAAQRSGLFWCCWPAQRW